MANLTNEKAEFAIAIFRHFSPLAPPPPPPPPPPVSIQYARAFKPRGFSRAQQVKFKWKLLFSGVYVRQYYY